MVKDLTEGKPLKLIFSFFVPFMCCNLFQQIYNIADSIIVGRFVGADALAAVGSTGSITFLFLGFINGACAGCAVPVARHFGAKQFVQMRKSVANAIYFTLAVSAVLTVTTLLLLNQILILMRYPADIFTYSKEYLTFTFAGTVCMAFYNLSANLLRAVGDSRTPLISLFIACVVNVTLNIVFVKMGMAVIGVALATMIAQFLSVVFCGLYIYFRLPILCPKKSEWKMDWQAIWGIVSTGIPMGLQFSITAIGSIVVQSVVNSLGTLYVTAVTTANKVMLIFSNGIMEALGVTMVTYCSQNLGARRTDRIKRGVAAAWMIMACIISVTMLIFFFFSDHLVGMFLKADEPGAEKIIVLSRYFLRLMGYFLLPLASIFIFRNSIQGLGFSTVAMIGGFLELIGRSAISIMMLKPFGYHGVVWASPIAWLIAGIFFPIVFIVLLKRMEKQHAPQSCTSAAPTQQ